MEKPRSAIMTESSTALLWFSSVSDARAMAYEASRNSLFTRFGLVTRVSVEIFLKPTRPVRWTLKLQRTRRVEEGHPLFTSRVGFRKLHRNANLGIRRELHGFFRAEDLSI